VEFVMACSITITSVIYDPVTSTVHVTGTQAGVCPPVPSGVVEIVVKVLCAPGNTQQGIATPDAQGNWAVDISLICTCGGWVYVTASCATDATCSGSYQSGALQCEGNCPTGSIDWDIDDCNPDGTRNVRLKVNITSAPPTPTSIGQFDYGTGSFSQFVAFNAAGTYSDPLPPPGYPYVPGTPYTVRFIFAQPANCAPFTRVLSGLQPCQPTCPNVNVQVTASQPSDCTPNNTRLVTFAALVTGATPQNYEWDFPGGNPPSKIGLGSPPSTTVEYPAATASTPTASCTVRIFNGVCSYTGMDKITIPACGGGGTDGGGDGLCGSFTYVIAVLLGLTLALSILIATLYCKGVAVPPVVLGIVVGLGIATAAAIALAYILCRFHICPCLNSCDWRAIVWMASLIGAITALYLGGCCPLMYLVAVGLGLVALILFTMWVVRCEPSACEIWKHLLVALVSGTAVVLSYLVLIPIVSACGLSFVPAAVATLGGLVTIAVAATCH
jgi:hypothetical protein